MGYTEKTLASIVLVMAGVLGMVFAFVALAPTPTVAAWAQTLDLLNNHPVHGSDPGGGANPRVTLLATGSEVTATFDITGVDTNITALVLGAMTPQVSSSLTISVQDNDSLNDTESIRVILLFDLTDVDPSVAVITAAATGAEAVDTLAVFTWTKGSPFSSSTFQLTSPTTGSWSVFSTINPSSAATSGDFVLNLIPSKIAAFGVGGVNAAGWDLLVEVTDSGFTDTDSSSLRDQAMGAFAEISIDPVTVSFGNLFSNSSANPITDPADGTFDATSISNKTHALTIKASSTWTNGVDTLTLDEDGNPGVDAISLRADDDNTVEDSQFVTATAANITGHADDGRDTTEAGTVTPIGGFLDVGLVGAGTGFEGTITIIIDN